MLITLLEIPEAIFTNVLATLPHNVTRKINAILLNITQYGTGLGISIEISFLGIYLS